MYRLIYSIIYLFPFIVFSQEIDSTLIHLEKKLEIVITKTEKVETMLAIGQYELDHDFSRAAVIIPEVLTLIENNESTLKKDYKALALMQLGVLKRRLGKHSEALEHYLEALQLFEIEKDDKNRADVYHNIAMVHRAQKNYKKSIQYFNESIKVNSSLNNSFGVAQAIQMLGVSYSSMKQLDSALLCYDKAKSIFTTLKKDEQLQEVNDNLVALYRKQKDYDSALRLSLKNVLYSKANGKKLALCGNYYDTALVYEKLKEYKLAGKYVDSSLKIAKGERFIHRIAKGYRKRSQLWSKLDNDGAAHRDYKRYKKYSDSIYNFETASKIQELELKYIFEKEQQEAILITEGERTKKWLYFSLFIITLFGAVIIALLVRKNYRNKIELAALKHKTETQSLDQLIKIKEGNVKQLIADNTMRLTFKKEMLERIKTDLKSENAERLLKDLTNDLRLQIESEGKLGNLQEKINATNATFDNILKTRFSELTKGEREVASLLRLNLSVKEIMTIRNVSEDSVKSMRRRIRKKMLIPKEQSIEGFIQTIV